MAVCVKCGNKGLLLRTNYMGLCEKCQAEETAALKAEVESLKIPEYRDKENLEKQIERLKEKIVSLNEDVSKKQNELYETNRQLEAVKTKLVILNDEMALQQDFAIYNPRYSFANSDGYKDTLDLIRQKQKDKIKAGTAVTGSDNWTVNGSAAQGKKMVADMQKLLLRAFNGECDDAVEHVKHNNYEQSLKKITASREAISKLGKIMSVAITDEYFALKVEELTLALEYAMKKQQEKEAQKEARERMREEAKLQKEIEEARKKAEKEHQHYQKALEKLTAQIQAASADDLAELEAKREELVLQLNDCEKAIKDIDYREANQKAGYVYVVSNIGSFGEGVYKIGMTRRLDPLERIEELGDASVPFDFDVHAMIFSDDAPALEAALHKAFESRKVNMVNHRREFFKVSLQEIKAEVRKNYDKTTEWTDVPAAEQYRISCKMAER